MVSKKIDLVTWLTNWFQTTANKVNSWSSTTSHTKYPSEKLVKDSLDAKSNTGHTHDDRYYTESEVNTALNGKQSTLVSGSNIKTINNESLLGNGNINLQGGGSYLNDFYEDLTTNELIIDYTTYIDPTGSEIVTDWQSTPSDSNIPSEKLVKDSLDSISNLNNTTTVSVVVTYIDNTTETLTLLKQTSS